MSDARSRPEQIQGRNRNYVNHEDELATGTAVASRSGNQVVVLGGIPGSGKTATAIELMFRVADDLPDGSLFARLTSSLERPGAEAEVLGDFLHALGVPHQDIPDRLDARRAHYQSLTAGGRFRVLLDGAVSAGQVRTLLPGDGDSLVVVTEGRPLSALAVDTPVTFLELSPFGDEAARELLARLVDSARVAAEPAAVTELIELCGHLPIALCVVGAMVNRSPSRTFESMVERLRDERRRIVALSRVADLSVESVFTAAYRLLGDSAQLCYRALGLRPRSGQLAADAVAAALQLPEYEVDDALRDLVDARLVEELAQGRFAVRELVGLHAEHLDTRPAADREAETARLLDFYHRRVVDAGVAVAPARPWVRSLFPDLRAVGEYRRLPDGASAALAWLRIERPNLLAAIDHLAELGEYERVVRWCVLLWPFYEKDKHLADLFATHERGLVAARELGNASAESLLCSQLGFGHYWLRDLDEAAAAFEDAVRLAEEAGGAELAATALEGFGLVEVARGDVPKARELLRRNLELALATGDRRRLALARMHLAKAEEPETALVLLAEADETFADLANDERVNRAKVATWRGRKLAEQGDWAPAGEALAFALTVMTERARRFDVAEVLDALGDLAAGRGEPATALEYYREALVCHEDLGFSALAAAVRRKINELGRP